MIRHYSTFDDSYQKMSQIAQQSTKNSSDDTINDQTLFTTRRSGATVLQLETTTEIIPARKLPRKIIIFMMVLVTIMLIIVMPVGAMILGKKTFTIIFLGVIHSEKFLGCFP